MRSPTTVRDPYIGDRMDCPGCDRPLTLTPQDGWCGPHVSCVGNTVHSDWIITVFSNPAQVNPISRSEVES